MQSLKSIIRLAVDQSLSHFWIGMNFYQVAANQGTGSSLIVDFVMAYSAVLVECSLSLSDTGMLLQQSSSEIQLVYFHSSNQPVKFSS